MDGVDEETQKLERLADLLTRLSASPYDVALHAQHISLAMSLPGMDSQVLEAREMAANYVAVGDEVWIPLIDDKAASLVMEEGVRIAEILELYERAERDYLSIPLLLKHVEFLINIHEHFRVAVDSPEELREVFTSQWARDAIDMAVARGAGHLSQVSVHLWQLQRDWEFDILESTPAEDRRVWQQPPLVDYVENLILARLQQPHSGHEDTFQSYSSFTTKYKPASEYEGLLVAASKLRSRAAKAYERREATELRLTSLDAYAQFISSERRAKNPDVFVLAGVYERAIAEAAKRRFSGEVGAEEALRSFWIGYLDFSRTHGIEDREMTTLLRRATRSVPGSGEAWARYIRHLEKFEDDPSRDGSVEDLESISDAYTRALSTNLFTKVGKGGPDRDPEQIIPLVLARASAEKHAIEAGRADEESLADLVKIVEEGLAMVRRASKTGDPRFRLEKFLSELYLNLAGLPDAAVQLWAATAKHYKSSWASWVAYTDGYSPSDARTTMILARSTFEEISTKNLDYPEALWDAWINFEYAHGSLASLEEALARIERTRTQVEARRIREAQKAFETAQAQYAMEQETVSVPTSAAVPETGKGSVADDTGESMDVDKVDSGALGKRKADDDPPIQATDGKRQRLGKLRVGRDREKCTVFVADLPLGTSEEQLTALFKDCGEIREVKITQLPQVLVATVEFTARDSVPAALTKDKKRIGGAEVNVHLAWRSTLYVTNFPEKWDDTSVRSPFRSGSSASTLLYPWLFDVRWPSKKFKTTRRFCYVQYTSPQSAERALELHGREVEPERTLNVYMSNPERKKGRTDADANEREVYVAGLSKFTTKDDLRGLFSRYGPVKDIRLAEDKNGQLKGFAFVEFQNEADARSALSANNHELKKRRIAVTLADTRVRSKNRESFADTGLGRRAEARNRSVRIRNLPPDAQEGLLQQVLEKHAAVKRVEILSGEREAIVELESAAEAGKLTLRTEPIVFNNVNLDIAEELPSGAAPPVKTGGAVFVPRTAVSRPRAGLGRPRKPGIGSAATANRSGGISTSSGDKTGKSQDDFRKMLG
ncbi:hypothetical protein EDC04DRAFT_2560886 [Pisolithus marmoratus]|nr:hypothetical protein EDC04DRAFT_2560886 [Pisolithus marmoratus]